MVPGEWSDVTREIYRKVLAHPKLLLPHPHPPMITLAKNEISNSMVKNTDKVKTPE